LPLNFKKSQSAETLVNVYNFHNLKNQQRFFLFSLNRNSLNITYNNNKIFSITELFSNANWLEREAAELSGVLYFFKKDLRNLMLQYGETSHPLKKTLPSIGLKEIYYDSFNDFLIQTNVTVQF